MRRGAAAAVVIFYVMLLGMAFTPYLLGGLSLRVTLWMALAIAAGMLLSLVGLRLRKKRFRAATSVPAVSKRLLLKCCDPDAYVKKARRRLDAALKRKPPADVRTLRLDLAAGLYAAGLFDDSLLALPHPSQFTGKRADRFELFLFHHWRYVNLLAIGVTDQARLALLSMSGTVGAARFGRTRRRMDEIYYRDYYLYEMACGRYDGAEEAFADMFGSAKNNYGRVLAMLGLGRVHAHFGRSEQAREASEYAARHGNRLYAAAAARERLEKL